MTFQEWQQYAAKLDAIAKRVKEMQDDRAKKLAETVGLPWHGCIIHNAAIDDGMTGWCKDNPQRLKVAKRVKHMANDWTASRLRDAAVKRAWGRIDA